MGSQTNKTTQYKPASEAGQKFEPPNPQGLMHSHHDVLAVASKVPPVEDKATITEHVQERQPIFLAWYNGNEGTGRWLTIATPHCENCVPWESAN